LAQGLRAKFIEERRPEFRRLIWAGVVRSEERRRFVFGQVQTAAPRDEKLASNGSLGVEEHNFRAARCSDFRRAQTRRPASDDRDLDAAIQN
jgi:hypothetical protein